MDKLRNVTALSGVLAVCIMALVLLSGRATINFTHTPMVMKIHEDNYYRIIRENGRLKIYLTTTIGPPDAYLTLINAILSEENDITMYLSGNGGQVDTAISISNAILASRTKVHAVLYGNVYSAHAVIASNADTITPLNPFITMMFHRPAYSIKGEKVLTKERCKIYVGKKDRRQDAYVKCLKFESSYENNLDMSVLQNMYKGLDTEQVQQYREGHDVIIYASEFVYNLNKANKK